MAHIPEEAIGGPFRLIYENDDGTLNGLDDMDGVSDLSEAFAWAQSLADKLGKRVELCHRPADPPWPRGQESLPGIGGIQFAVPEPVWATLGYRDPAPGA